MRLPLLVILAAFLSAQPLSAQPFRPMILVITTA